MKIELIVPEDMLCGFINCVCGDKSGLMLRTHQIGTEEIKNGKVIVQSDTVFITVEEAPTADVVPVVHGEWKLFDECSNAGVYCSICHKAVYRESAWYKNVHIKSKYCPNCGAKMDKEEHREYD